MSVTATADHGPLAHHFENLEQQSYAALLGMWMFLITEVLLFGGVFCAYTVYRSQPAVGPSFAAASQHLGQDVLGLKHFPLLALLNTVVLIGSSLTMALAVNAAGRHDRRGIVIFLGLTLVLGAAFLGIKAYEYHHDYVERLIPGLNFDPSQTWMNVGGSNGRSVQLFFLFYFILTGLHAFHMLIGMTVLGIQWVMASRGRFDVYGTPVELAGLYWHFVDVVWIFLFPLLYLIRH